ncbi:DsbA family protein [Pseudothioclava arenosa]|uniref:Disulfide bond formation protein DsbA n=1 Tax=Pseudothioclava arenosa TaxID=1795308 RepID=A0A2A4CU97_9RHOB|nr:DsbA family protein [Pseudothioclava arenosa]PCD77654.1 disulfide bond formation protein DsbA [Pseudothioclava arenosa]
MTRKLLAALSLSSAMALPAAAFDISAMSEGEKAAFGEAVREYLMANPEVLIESINVLEERQQAMEAQNDQVLVETNAKDLFEDGYSWVGGNPDGDVTIVEFLDYKCGYCKKAYQEVEKLLESDGNIRFIVKEFPILGEQSDLSSRFAVAVLQLAGPEAYEKTHNAMMAFRGDFTLESLSRLAKDQGLDADALLKRMNEEEVTAVLRANHQLAERMRISGTPAFVIGGELMRGYAPVNVMEKIVADQRG